MSQTPSPIAPLAWSLPGGLVEKPGQYPGEAELCCYTDEFSYRAGDEVGIKVHTNAATFDIEIIRDGHSPVTVYRREGIPGIIQQTPPDAYAVGCGWTDALTVAIDPTWTPGFYLIVVRTRTRDGHLIEREGFFLLSTPSPVDADFVLIHATSTVLAYNDWGGANHYRGLPDGAGGFDTPTPISSARRPIARGMLRKPIGAPREPHRDVPPPHWRPRFASYEWAWHSGYSRHHADAGWATYERPFTVWAEQSGYTVAHISQTDLHRDPRALDGYRCAVAVGHDEYWSWEMRDRVDHFVDAGGGFARFGGNYLWQVRLDDDGTQICYKDPRHDPVTAVDPTRCTTVWDWPRIGRPGAATMGLTGLAGIYNRYGPTTPRSSGGFTVYRPDHWALQGSDLYYGDVFGGVPVCVAAFEMDGVDYTFRKGRPYPTGFDGAPENLEIIAMAPAVTYARDRWNGEVPVGAPMEDVHQILDMLFAGDPPDHLRDLEYGAGMVASFIKGQGEVFNAGSAEWVNGLAEQEWFTSKITRTVLDRFSDRRPENA